MSKPQTLCAEIAALGPEKYVRLEDVLAKVEQYEADLQKHLRSLWYSEAAENPHYKAALEDLQYFTNIPLGFYLNTPDAERWRERNAENAAKAQKAPEGASKARSAEEQVRIILSPAGNSTSLLYDAVIALAKRVDDLANGRWGS